MFGNWMTLGFDSSMLALESQAVIGLRLAKIAGGGNAAHSEVQEMISEKIFASGETAVMLATGGSTSAVVASYRRKVRANRRRLSGSRKSR